MHYEILYAETRTCPGKCDTNNCRGPWDTKNHQIPAGFLDIALINKRYRTQHLVNLAVPVDHRVKRKESKKIDKYLDLARELKKLHDMNVTDTNCHWSPWNGCQRPRKENWRIGDQRKIRNYPDHSIVEISLVILKSSWDLRRLSISEIFWKINR